MPEARRVAVTHPHARKARPIHRRPAVRGEPVPDPGRVRAVMRAQLRLALATGGAVGGVLAGLPLLFALAGPALGARLYGIPVPWLVLGLCVHPLWVAVAARHVRRAERIEDDLAGPPERSCSS